LKPVKGSAGGGGTRGEKKGIFGTFRGVDSEGEKDEKIWWLKNSVKGKEERDRRGGGEKRERGFLQKVPTPTQ